MGKARPEEISVNRRAASDSPASKSDVQAGRPDGLVAASRSNSWTVDADLTVVRFDIIERGVP